MASKSGCDLKLSTKTDKELVKELTAKLESMYEQQGKFNDLRNLKFSYKGRKIFV